VKNRSVVEIMVIVFTFVVGFIIVGMSILILIVEANTPEADTSIIANTVMSLVSGILGALLGLIAGKSTGSTNLDKRPDGEEVDL
jgi:hypothetical protein